MATRSPKSAPTASKPDDAATTDAAQSAERNRTLLNEEIFESAMEMQMSFFEAASRFAQEFSNFASQRAASNVGDMSKFAGAKTPPELLQAQLEHMRRMFEDYSKEARRLLALTEDIVKESGEAVRSSYLNKELPEAG